MNFINFINFLTYANIIPKTKNPTPSYVKNLYST